MVMLKTIPLLFVLYSCTTKPLFRRPPERVPEPLETTINLGEFEYEEKQIHMFEEEDILLEREINLHFDSLQTSDEKAFFDLGKKAVDIRTFFSWPVLSRSISSHYGNRVHPITNKKAFHKGIDIRAKEGTPIHASQSGRVIISKYSKSYGNIIAIAHSNGYVSLYGHNKINFVKVGEEVLKNQKIGEVGKTGMATGSHLHFEIRNNKNNLDPYKFLNNQKNYFK